MSKIFYMDLQIVSIHRSQVAESNHFVSQNHIQLTDALIEGCLMKQRTEEGRAALLDDDESVRGLLREEFYLIQFVLLSLYFVIDCR